MVLGDHNNEIKVHNQTKKKMSKDLSIDIDKEEITVGEYQLIFF